MDTGDRNLNPDRINRREALKRTAIVTGAAWTAPVLMSMQSPAFAGSPTPCEEGCRYVFRVEDPPPRTCSQCQGGDPDCAHACSGEGFCRGPACARVTSIEGQDGFIRFCTDCQLEGRETYCERSPGCCACTAWQIDPNDARCGFFFYGNCGAPRAIEIYFRCATC